MTDEKDLSSSFEQHRAHLRSAAYRMLGSLSEADDAVQEAWLRASRADSSGIENLRGWLTTITARVCLDMLRSRKARREDAVEPPEVAAINTAEEEAALADAVGLALLVVLETLDPDERLAFVLHDLFGMSFDEIAPIVGRSSAAARQLASRARRRVRGAPSVDDAELARQRDLVNAFLTALREGDVEGVVTVLHPDAIVRAEVLGGAAREFRGARAWAKSAVAYNRANAGAAAAALALIDGAVGAILAPHGQLARVLQFTFEGGVIARVDIIVEKARLRGMEIAVLPD